MLKCERLEVWDFRIHIKTCTYVVLALYIARAQVLLLTSSFFLDIFFLSISSFPHVFRISSTAFGSFGICDLHRFHSYNIGNNLLYHSVAPERRREFPFDSSGFAPYGWRLTFLASVRSRIECVHLWCLAAFSLGFQFTFSVDGAAWYGENISGMRLTTRRAFKNQKANTTSRRFC